MTRYWFVIAALLLPAWALAQTEEPTQAPQAELTKVPKLINFHEADYPPKALAEGLEAEVVLEIDIDANGEVEAATVLVPATPVGYGFDEAAMLAVQMFSFEPAEAGGVPIPVRISYKYRFTMAVPEVETQEQEPQADPVINFQGTLLERGTRDVLPGVVITVFRGEGESAAGFEAISDADGTFVFYDLVPGEWKIMIAPQGYFPVRTTEEIVVGELTEAIYYVEKGSYNPFDILVEATRPRKEVSRTTIATKEIEKIPGSFGDVLAVVQNLPSVARVTPFASGEPGVVVRGASPADTLVFVNGVTVPLIYHFGGIRSVIPTGMLQNLDFYPGNFGTYYGRATGGVLDIGLKRLDPEKLGGYVDVSLLDTSLFLEMPLGEDGAVAIGGRRSYIDFILNATIPDDAPVSFDTAPRYWDAEILGHYRLAEGHNIRVFFMNSDDRVEVLFENPADLSAELEGAGFGTSTDFYRSIVEYDYVPSKNFSNTLSTAQGMNWLDFNLGDNLFFDLDWYLAQIRDTVRWQINDEVLLVGGLDYLYNRWDIAIALPLPPKEGEPNQDGDLSEIRTFSEKDRAYHSLGAFTELEYVPTEGLLLTPGLRFDYFQRVSQSKIAPRVGARYDIHEQWTLKGGAGFFFQEPTFDETAGGFGNADLVTEQAIQYSVGAEYRPTSYLSFDVTGFYKSLTDVVTPSDGVVERDGETVPENYTNDGTGRVYGAEVLIRHQFANNFFGWLSYTLSRAERRDDPDEDRRLFDFDQTHILTVLGTYKLPRNWEVGFRWRLVSGNPETDVLRGVFNSDIDEFQPVFGAINTSRLPPFHQLDFRIDKRWIYEDWILNAYLDIQNLYDRANPEDRSYNFDFSESTEASGLPILPVIGLRGEF